MVKHNSYAEFVLGVYEALLVDCASFYPGLVQEFGRDLKRLGSALDDHGVAFFMDTLATYGKHFDKCLSRKRLTPSGLTHFGPGKRGEVIPRLFRGLFVRVFERSGVMRTDPDINAIRLLRQLFGAVKRMRLECSEAAIRKAVTEFVKIDSGLASASLAIWSDPDAQEDRTPWRLQHFVDSLPEDPGSWILGLHEPVGQGSASKPEVTRSLLEKLQQVADLLTAEIGVFDPYLWRPRHGPGAVSDLRTGEYKYDFPRWSERLECVFPWADFAFANWSMVPLIPKYGNVGRALDHEVPARMIAVPKTLKTPRLIAAEPTSAQWCQQIIRDFLYSRVRSTPIKAFIDFSRQDKNGKLALAASIGGHATIDLSSASDRISCWHVERLFRRSPTLLRALASSRSWYMKQEYCQYSPQFIKLRKYSTMGNATTFPVQSLFFLAICLAAHLEVHRRKVSWASVMKAARSQVRVFGDDIIVPEDCARVVVALLEHLQLKVNDAKTFLDGNFKESCGVDAYAGHDVTRVAILDVPSGTSPGSIVSSVDVHKNLCSRGYVATAGFIRKTAVQYGIAKCIPTVMDGSGCFGWSDLEAPPHRLKKRWNRNTQVVETKCASPYAKTHRRLPETNAGLLQYFTEAPKVVTSAVTNLGHTDRRGKAGLRLTWVSLGPVGVSSD